MSYSSGYKSPYKPAFFEDPLRDLLDALEIRSTRFNEDTMRVNVYGRESRLIRSYKYEDKAMAEHARDEFNKVARSCQAGEFYEPNWDLPLPPKAKTSAG